MHGNTGCMADITFGKNTEDSQYEVFVDGELAGLAEYIETPTEVVFPHTETFDKFAGQGLASQLVQYALDRVREEGELKVVPLCPFVVTWMKRHPEYHDLVKH